MFLPTLIATITRHPRFKQDWKWYSNSWSGNLFVLWHKLFWQRCGKNGIGDTIRAEASVNSYYDKELEKQITTYIFHSWEALFIHIEQAIRGKFPLKIPLRISIPMLKTPMGVSIPISPYLFAIAFDTSSVGANTNTFGHNSPLTYNYTCTGSNPLLVTLTFNFQVTGAQAAVTYNAASMTQLATIDVVSLGHLQFFYTVGPPTGSSNQVAVTFTASNDMVSHSASYSGVSQTGFPDSSTTNFGVSGTLTATTTVVASNCWLIGMSGNGNTAPTAGTNCTIRQNGGGFTSALADSNGTVGTSGQTMTETVGSTSWSMILASIAPSGGVAAAVLPFKALMGVGI